MGFVLVSWALEIQGLQGAGREEQVSSKNIFGIARSNNAIQIGLASGALVLPIAHGRYLLVHQFAIRLLHHFCASTLVGAASLPSRLLTENNPNIFPI